MHKKNVNDHMFEFTRSREAIGALPHTHSYVVGFLGTSYTIILCDLERERERGGRETKGAFFLSE